MLAGAVLPPLLLAHDWRIAFAVVPAAALALAVLAPWGRLGGREIDVAQRSDGSMLSGTVDSLRSVFTSAPIRAVAYWATSGTSR